MEIEVPVQLSYTAQKRRSLQAASFNPDYFGRF